MDGPWFHILSCLGKSVHARGMKRNGIKDHWFGSLDMIGDAFILQAVLEFWKRVHRENRQGVGNRDHLQFDLIVSD